MANIKTRSRLLTAPVDIWRPEKYSGIKIADWLNWKWYIQKMGMLAGGFYSQGGGGSGYTLKLGDSFGDINSGGGTDTGNANIRIYGGGHATREGEVWVDNTSGTLVQWEASSNWVIPNSDADSETWQARFTSLTGDTAQLSGNAKDTWFNMTSSSPFYAECTLAEPVPVSTQYSASGTAQIRIGTGPVEVSGNCFWDTETGSGKATGK